MKGGAVRLARRRFSPILPAMMANAPWTMGQSFKVGDKVVLLGNTEHPEMFVVGQQADLFETDQPPRVLCTWKVGAKRRWRHCEPTEITRVSGLSEDGGRD
jgi:hypothetical protein